MKKAEVSTEQIVTFALALAGFIVLIVAFAIINWEGETKKQVCELSVAQRANLPDSLDIKELAPLKCETKMVCVSEEKNGKCGNLGNDFETIEITKDKTKQETEIKQILAREMKECWEMMGKGEIKVFSRDITGEQKTSATKKCSICTKFEFDETITDDLKEINGFVEYLMTRKSPNMDTTYFKFLTNNGISENKIIGDVQLIDLDKIDLTKEKSVVFLEASKTRIGAIFGSLLGGIGGGAAGVGGVMILGSLIPGVNVGIGTALFIVSTTTATGTIVGAEAGGATQSVIFNSESEYSSGVFLTDYSRDDLRTGLGCDVFKNI